MSFTAKYHGECGYCGEEMKDTECSFASDHVLVHTGCLVPYATGVSPDATQAYRTERHCPDCFQIHAGECL